MDLSELKEVSPIPITEIGVVLKMDNFYLNKDAVHCCLLFMGCGSCTREWMEMKGNGGE